MKEFKNRLIELAKESVIMRKFGVISIGESIQITIEDWHKFASEEKVKVTFWGMKFQYPFVTSFKREGVEFFAVWTTGEYLEVYQNEHSSGL